MSWKVKKITEENLLRAIERTGNSLRHILQDKKIDIRLVRHKKGPELTDFKAQWDFDTRFTWGKLTEGYNQNSKSFTLALYHGSTLTGLCQYDNEEAGLEIFKIENKIDDNPLKGYVIAAFSQASLDIAKESKINRLTVYKPEPGTIPSYLRLGFSQRAGDQNSVFYNTKQAHTVNWDNVFQHLQAKGHVVPQIPALEMHG